MLIKPFVGEEIEVQGNYLSELCIRLTAILSTLNKYLLNEPELDSLVSLASTLLPYYSEPCGSFL